MAATKVSQYLKQYKVDTSFCKCLENVYTVIDSDLIRLMLLFTGLSFQLSRILNYFPCFCCCFAFVMKEFVGGSHFSH